MPPRNPSPLPPSAPPPPHEKGTGRNGTCTLMLKRERGRKKKEIKRYLRHVACGNREGGFFSLSFFSFVLDWIGGIDAEVRLVLLILL